MPMMRDHPDTDRQDRRLRRQFEAMERSVPGLAATLRSVREGRLRIVRIPMALVLIAGGFVGFLPVLGFWMIPLGLLLLAIDIPLLRPAISAGLVRGRRRWRSATGPQGRLAWLGRWLRQDR